MTNCGPGPLNLAKPLNVNAMTAAQQGALGAVQGSMEVQTNWPYWSRLRFRSVLTGGGAAPATYTIPVQTLKAFGYAEGADMGAGGRPGVQAQLCDTNIQSNGETIGGQNLYINRIGIQNNPISEPEMLKRLAPEVSVRISLDGGMTQFNAGTLLQMPGGGGLFGSENSAIDTQPIPGGRPFAGSMVNGWPMHGNKTPVPTGLIWQRKGGTDSNLQILLQLHREIVFTTQIGNEIAVPEVVRGYTNPEATDVFVDLLVIVDALVIQARSRNA